MLRGSPLTPTYQAAFSWLTSLPYSAIHILYELTKAYSERGVGLHFAHLRASQSKLFQLVGIADLVRHLSEYLSHSSNRLTVECSSDPRTSIGICERR